MKQEILKRLEEMAENPEGVLAECVEESCDRIRILPRDFDIIPRSEENPNGLSDAELSMELRKMKYWVGRKDAPRLHDEVLAAYKGLGFQEGMSGAYCPDHVPSR